MQNLKSQDYERRGSGLIVPRMQLDRSGFGRRWRKHCSMLVGAGGFWGGSSGGAGDPHFANVALLLGFDSDANGATTTTDESPAGTAVTFHGAAAVSNAESAFSSGEAVYFPGTAGNYLSVPHSTAFSVGNTNDKTYECMLYVPADGFPQPALAYIFDKRASAGNTEFSLGFFNTGVLFFPDVPFERARHQFYRHHSHYRWCLASCRHQPPIRNVACFFGWKFGRKPCSIRNAGQQLERDVYRAMRLQFIVAVFVRKTGRNSHHGRGSALYSKLHRSYGQIPTQLTNARARWSIKTRRHPDRFRPVTHGGNKWRLRFFPRCPAAAPT